MLQAIYLPRLNRLTPSLDSTLLKIMEEAGELARAVLVFLPHEGKEPTSVETYLHEVAGELLDVAQTCVTMLFVLEEAERMTVDRLVERHLEKLQSKGYVFDRELSYRVATDGDYKFLQLPRLELPEVTLLTTVCKIQEEVGELSQYLGKKAGASGECPSLDRAAVLEGCCLELLDVAQCCFTMMHILAERYGVPMRSLLDEHVSKLRRKGYCS